MLLIVSRFTEHMQIHHPDHAEDILKTLSDVRGGGGGGGGGGG